MKRSRHRKAEAAADDDSRRHTNASPCRSLGQSTEQWVWSKAAALVVVVLVAYLPAVPGDFIWDDDAYVSQNAVLTGENGLWRIWTELGATPQYYPLVFTTFWIEYRLWGLEPQGYHLVNILLHGLSAVVLWRILSYLRIPAAWFAAALFALHPVHVESVAWITERKNTLSALFYLLAACAYLHWRPPGGADSTARRKAWLYVMSLILFAAALLSKTVTASLPAALLLILWWRRGRVTRRELVALLPVFLLGLVLGLVTKWMETHYVGTKHVPWDLSFFDRILIAGRTVWFYVAKLAWPRDLTFIYPRWDIDTGVWWQFLYPVAAAAAVGALWTARKRFGRGPLVAVLYFLVTLFPALGFVDVYPMRFSFVADHFQYLASLGILVIAAAGFWHLTVTFGKQLWSYYAGGSVVLFLLGILTWNQSQVYRDLDTLWNDTNRKNPNSQLVHTSLGIRAMEQGRDQEARVHLKTAIDLDPDFESAHLALGIVLAEQGDVDEAVRHLKKTLDMDPRSAKAHYRLARIYRQQKKHREALLHYRNASRIAPNMLDVVVECASLLQELGSYDESLALYRKALELTPDQSMIYYNMGVVFDSANRVSRAEGAYREALRRNPCDPFAHYNLGNLLARQGRFSEAVHHYQESLRWKPDFREATQNLQAAQRDLQKHRTAPQNKPGFREPAQH